MKPADGRTNILFIFVQMDILGGSERLVYHLVERIDRTRFNPSLAWFYGDRKRRDFERLGVCLYQVPKTKRFDLGTMRRMAAIIEENDIQVVNAHHFLSLIYAFYGCKVRDRAGLVYTEHSAWEVDRISAPWRRIGREVLARTDAAVGVSEPVSERIRTVFCMDRTKVATIANGVDLGALAPRCAERTLRRRLGLSETDLVVGIVANLRRVKNHLLLFRAFRALSRDLAGVKLVLVGQGPAGEPDNTEPSLRQFTADHGLADRVLFLGYRTDIPELLHLMDLFCLTSTQEGLPISLIEAMAAGLPVIGTDAPGIREVIDHGANGFLVPQADPGPLEQRMRQLLSDRVQREAFGRRSRAIAMERYSLAACVARYQDLFARVRRPARDAGTRVQPRAEAV